MPPHRTVAALLVAGVVTTFAQQQPPQTFRSGVDLILIEATALDKDGRPITDLQARDFSVKLGGNSRTVAALEYIPAGKAAAVAPASLTPGAPATAAMSSADAAFGPARAQLAASDRTIVLAVDVNNIRSGAGRNALVDVADYVATLQPSDRIGIMTLPGGGTTVEPTTDRARIRDALSRMVGTDHRVTSCDPTIGEAAAEAVEDDRGLEAWSIRAPPQRCPLATHARLRQFAQAYRAQAQQVLRALKSLADALSAVPGRRVIVLVSEGLYVDLDIVQEMPAFGAALERSRVVLYAIHLDFPFAESSAQFARSDTRLLDDRYGFDGMANAAVFGGGAAIRAVSRATAAIAQIDRELSGAYLLGIERLPTDVSGKQLEVKVEVMRKGVDVRSRRNVTISR